MYDVHSIAVLIIAAACVRAVFMAVRSIASLFNGSSARSEDAAYQQKMYLLQQIQDMQRLAMEQNQREFDDFSQKSVTPFEHGGFDMTQGNSFNNHTGM